MTLTKVNLMLAHAAKLSNKWIKKIEWGAREMQECQQRSKVMKNWAWMAQTRELIVSTIRAEMNMKKIQPTSLKLMTTLSQKKSYQFGSQSLK
jgi:hypothetical protein